jgi:hypothetical protein
MLPTRGGDKPVEAGDDVSPFEGAAGRSGSIWQLFARQERTKQTVVGYVPGSRWWQIAIALREAKARMPARAVIQIRGLRKRHSNVGANSMPGLVLLS